MRRSEAPLDADAPVAECDVAVVGFGPAGQALASILGRAGHRVIVVEKWEEPYNLPRMSTLDGEIARLMQHVAVPGALSRAVAQRSVDMIGANGEKVATIDWNDLRGGHPSHLSVHQPDIESAMMARIAELRSVRVRWGTEAVAIHDDGERVELTTVCRGLTERIHAQYLVGMDGASSFVREALDIPLEVVHRHEDRWVMTDFDILGPLPNDLESRYIFDLSLESPYFYGLNGAGRCRVDARVDPWLSDEEVMGDSDGGLTFMQARLGVDPNLLKQSRRVLYRFRSQMAESFRVGRAFIGGDAAHAMTPFLGQGACTAMRDSVNLGWKLDLVLSGKASEVLLDTYESERWEHDAQFVHSSLGMWAFANQPDAESASDRDRFMREQDGSLGMFIEPLTDGVLHRKNSTASPAAWSGELAPQGRVTAHGRTSLLDDIVGFGFQLVFRDARAAQACDLAGVENELTELGGHLVILGDGPAHYGDVDGSYATFFESTNAAAFLARPDFYLFGVAETGAEVDDLVAELHTQLTNPTPSRPRSE